MELLTEAPSRRLELGDGKFLDAAKLEEFARIAATSEYMMDLESARSKPDGQAEQEAVGKYKPLFQLLRVDDAELNSKRLFWTFKAFLNSASNLVRHDKKKETHVDLTGSKFHIPEVSCKIQPWQHTTEEGTRTYNLSIDELTFLKLYAMCYQQGRSFWLVEQRTPVFRLFMDLDFKQPESLTGIKVEAVSYIVAQSIKKCFQSTESGFFRIIVSATTVKEDFCSGCACSCFGTNLHPTPTCGACKGTGCTGKSKVAVDSPCPKCGGNFSVKKKTGIHIHWPHIYVTSEQVTELREIVLADLILAFGLRTAPFNDWRDVLDLAVYKAATGLRMLGSRKAEVCKSCHGKRRTKEDEKVCAVCEGYGRVDGKRPYVIHHVTDNDGRRDKQKEIYYSNNFYALMCDTKIRTDFTDPTAGFKLPEGAPTFETSGENGGMAKLKSGKEIKHKTPQRSTQVRGDMKEVHAIQEWFKNECPNPKYRSLVVTALMRCNPPATEKTRNMHYYTVSVTGTNCRYCLNVGRDHKSNRIYFTIHNDGIRPRCFDPTDAMESDMKFGLCKTFNRDGTHCKWDLCGSLSVLLFSSEDSSTVVDSGSGTGTGTGTGTGHDSAAATEALVVGLRDVRMRSLLDVSNLLSQHLFSVNYTTSARFYQLFGEKVVIQQTAANPSRERKAWSREQINSYTQFTPDLIGSLGDAPLRALGFQVDIKEAPIRKRAAGLQPLPPVSNLTQLHADIQRVLHTILWHALNSNEDQVLFALEPERFRKHKFEGLLQRVSIKRKPRTRSIEIGGGGTDL